ncbi:MAG TPA: histidine kinase [Geobacter sp.]|nr:histidine kinase [Geobacter sp.]
MISQCQTRILCVDDERNVLRALERIFLDDDYDILTASSGEEGLEILNSTEEVQVVISDFRMPGMNGVEFLKEVFQRRPETIRIVLSGYADTAAVVSAINEGKIYKFIPKPWNDDELRVTVAKALETFTIQHRNEQLAEELKLKTQELSELNANLERLASQCDCGSQPQHRDLIRAERLLELLPVGVIVLDPAGAVIRVNREAGRMLRVEGEAMVGKSWREALPPELSALAADLPRGRNRCRMAAADGSELQVQGVASADGGNEVILAMSRC